MATPGGQRLKWRWRTQGQDRRYQYGCIRLCPQLVRVWRMIRVLDQQAAGVTVRELANAQHVHKRTALRDLMTLKAAGLPLVEIHEGRRSRFFLEEWRTPDVRRRQDPRRAALLARLRQIQEREGTPVAEQVHLALEQWIDSRFDQRGHVKGAE